MLHINQNPQAEAKGVHSVNRFTILRATLAGIFTALHKKLPRVPRSLASKRVLASKW